MQAAGRIEHIRNPADERQAFVELTERSKALDELAGCLGPAVIGDSGITKERLFRLRDEVTALRDALNAKLAAKGRQRPTGRRRPTWQRNCRARRAPET